MPPSPLLPLPAAPPPRPTVTLEFSTCSRSALSKTGRRTATAAACARMGEAQMSRSRNEPSGDSDAASDRKRVVCGKHVWSGARTDICQQRATATISGRQADCTCGTSSAQEITSPHDVPQCASRKRSHAPTEGRRFPRCHSVPEKLLLHARHAHPLSVPRLLLHTLAHPCRRSAGNTAHAVPRASAAGLPCEAAWQLGCFDCTDAGSSVHGGRWHTGCRPGTFGHCNKASRSQGAFVRILRNLSRLLRESPASPGLFSSFRPSRFPPRTRL